MEIKVFGKVKAMHELYTKENAMKKLEFKKKVLDKARERQQEIIDDFQHRIHELQSSVMNINEDQHDIDQKSLDNSSSELINKLADQLNFVVEEMNVLLKMKVDDRLHEKVSIGSIVETDRKVFYPSVSVESFSVDGTELFGISVKAPLYKAMSGKKAGDVFSYQKTQYRIEDVY